VVPRKLLCERLERLTQAIVTARELLRRPRWVVGALLGLQWLLVLVFALSIPHNGWLWFQGGDETWYFTSGWLLGHLQLPVTPTIGYGWPLVLSPIAVATDGQLLSALPAIVLLNVLVLLPVALLCVYAVGTRIGGRIVGYTAALLWVVLPFVAIPLFDPRYHERFVDQVLPTALGLTAMADYPGMVLLLVSAYFLFRLLETHAPADAVLAGAAAAASAAVKPSNLLYFAPVGLALVASRRIVPAAWFTAGAAPALIALALWKERGLGYLPAFALEGVRVALGSASISPSINRYVNIDWGQLRQNELGIREYFWSVRLLEWLPIAGTIALARRSLTAGMIGGGWLICYIVIKGSSSYASVDSGSFFRFMIPAFPAFVVLAASLLLLVPHAPSRLKPSPLLVRSLPNRAVIAAVAVAGLVPLLVVAVARPLNTPKAVEDARHNLLVPVEQRLALRAERTSAGVRLTWRNPGGHLAFFRVFRTDDPPGLDCSRSEKSTPLRCQLAMNVIRTVRGTTFVDASSRNRDATYRVGLAANYLDDPFGGDVLAISEAAAPAS
jgi:hypothetical protein